MTLLISFALSLLVCIYSSSANQPIWCKALELNINHQGQERAILDLLKMMVDPEDAFPSSSYLYTDGKRYGSQLFLLLFTNEMLTSIPYPAKVMLYHAGQFPLGAIAPVSCLWRALRDGPNPEAKQQLWIWVHPSAYAELLQTLEANAEQHEGTVHIPIVHAKR